MKVFRQGTLADGSPYVHLGYLAATTIKTDGKFMTGGLLLIAAGLIVGFTLLVSRTLKGWTKIDVVPRRSRWWIAGLVMIVVGIGSVVVAFRRGVEVARHPAALTRAHADGITETILRLAEEGKEIPGDLASLKPALPPHIKTIDGWWHEMRLERADADDVTAYRVVSAGPDGLFDTDDDLRFEAPVSPPPEE